MSPMKDCQALAACTVAQDRRDTLLLASIGPKGLQGIHSLQTAQPAMACPKPYLSIATAR